MPMHAVCSSCGGKGEHAPGCTVGEIPSVQQARLLAAEKLSTGKIADGFSTFCLCYLLIFLMISVLTATVWNILRPVLLVLLLFTHMRKTRSGVTVSTTLWVSVLSAMAIMLNVYRALLLHMVLPVPVPIRTVFMIFYGFGVTSTLLLFHVTSVHLMLYLRIIWLS